MHRQRQKQQRGQQQIHHSSAAAFGGAAADILRKKLQKQSPGQHQQRPGCRRGINEDIAGRHQRQNRQKAHHGAAAAHQPQTQQPHHRHGQRRKKARDVHARLHQLHGKQAGQPVIAVLIQVQQRLPDILCLVSQPGAVIQAGQQEDRAGEQGEDAPFFPAEAKHLQPGKRRDPDTQHRAVDRQAKGGDQAVKSAHGCGRGQQPVHSQAEQAGTVLHCPASFPAGVMR